MKTILSVALLLWSCASAAQELPPDILADQYLLEATEAMEQGEGYKALRAFGKIEALNIEPPPMFAYSYGQFLVEHSALPEDWRKGQSLLKQFVISAGRDSEYYTPSLKLLSAVEAKLEEAAPKYSLAELRAERSRRAAHAAQLKEHLPEILRQVDAQMVRIEGGTFIMGCTPEQTDCRDDEKPAHQVRVSSFELSKYEVTQELWEAVMGWNPSRRNCPQCPVERVSWNAIQTLLQKLNAGGGRYRLPSEAEWEYAARGGAQSRGYKYAGSDNLDAVAWYVENSGLRLHPVGQKQANELGLYDLSGNVFEWVQDCWNGDYTGAPSDGRAWEREDCRRRVLRGGSWLLAPRHPRSASRSGNATDDRGYYRGFRLARSLP